MAETNKQTKPNWLRRKLSAAKTFLQSHKPDRNDVVAFIGVSLIVRGVAMWSVPAAFIFAGLAFLFVSYYSTPSTLAENPIKET